MRLIYTIPTILIYSHISYSSPDWSYNSELPGQTICKLIKGHKICLSNSNRKNIYNYNLDEHEIKINNGGKHVLNYPVTVTEMRIPKETMLKFFNSDSNSPLRRLIFNIAKKVTNFKNFDDVFSWLGLHHYPKSTDEEGPNHIPYMGKLESYHMGVSELKRNGYSSMSFSCAACHSANLFGTKVIGLTNRFPKANEAFILGEKILSKTPSLLFKAIVGPSKEDYKTFKDSKYAMRYVTTKKPLVLGLDTSLAQVGLSLSKRGLDKYARRIPNLSPRQNPLSKIPADSKPAVWWNVKYKTRWLSDGSIVSGNPVHTNFLWNEIGRGVDLKRLETWLNNNKQKVDELTSYVFNTEPPLYNDFFPNDINISLAKKGQKLFLKNCKGCHGIYEKNWDKKNSANYKYEDLIKTSTVWYHKRTKTIDVGTDPLRYQGMKYFAQDLNRLAISKSIGTVVKPQKGYVPPPLVGIWSRWPYFHNNSVPTLYDLLTPGERRPKYYVSVPSEDKEIDFDKTKNGYPSPNEIREPYKSDKEYFYDTNIHGLSNSGHSKMLKNEDGSDKFSHIEKLELIEFLKTL